jgi:uncharacterized phage protein (TIGR02216 family)
MAAGLGLLRLPPQQFWSMTPRELAAALRVVLPRQLDAAPPTRSQLDALIERFPD